MTDPTPPDRPGPVDWPQHPPLGPPPPVVPAPWANRRPREPEAPEVPPRRRGWLVALVAGLVLVAVAATALVVWRRTDDEETAAGGLTTTTAAAGTGGPSTTEEATTTTLVETDLEQIVFEISAFVEQERGLTFKDPVTVELAGDEEFNRRLLEKFDDDVDEIESSDDVLTAVGLIEPDIDLAEELRALYSEGVVGFYDAKTNELVVRGTSTTPYVRTVIAHELVHALDDQYFELYRPDVDDADDEQGFAFTALKEGDAVRIQDAYRATFNEDDEAAALEEEESIGAGLDIFSIPRIVLDSVVAPYQFGPVLVEAILDDGGQRALDSAFGEPPTTSEQFLDPSRFLEGDERKDVPVPEADGEVFDQGAIGAFTLAEMLDAVESSATEQAVEGWGGDWYVAWHDGDSGDRTCVRASLIGDTAADTTEIYDALRDWAGAQGDASVELTGETVTLTSCG